MSCLHKNDKKNRLVKIHEECKPYPIAGQLEKESPE